MKRIIIETGPVRHKPDYLFECTRKYGPDNGFRFSSLQVAIKAKLSNMSETESALIQTANAMAEFRRTVDAYNDALNAIKLGFV